MPRPLFFVLDNFLAEECEDFSKIMVGFLVICVQKVE